MADPWNEEFTGLHEVEFTTGETRRIDIIQNLVDVNAHPIWLICATGRIYNWMNIVSVRRM